jgi:hypothetical protein
MMYFGRKCRYHPYIYYSGSIIVKNKSNHKHPRDDHTTTAMRNAYLYKRARTLERVIGICVENITQLIKVHGWYRVNRQLQHTTRGKEFVCSMLYLMRMGITFKNQNILQRVDILNDLLPMQVFLPSVFNIRAKSITEGENIIKLDIQRMPI